jgi:hypothetical protein
VFSKNDPRKILVSSSRSPGNSLYCLHTSSSKISSPYKTPSFNLAAVTTPSSDTSRSLSIALTPSELWHNRIAHLNYQSLYNLSHGDMVTRIPLLPKIKEICEPCILGKHQRTTIPKVSTSSTNRILEIVHSDLCGPLPHRSMTGSRYILSFIDHYFRRSWVYFLAVKSETFDTFRSFKSTVEKKTNEKVSCLRIDPGGEYLSSEFNTFYKQQGIKRQLTTTGTPQQNGLDERKNRHICETMRSLLFGAKLPTIMWEEVAHTTNYISNRTPHQALHRIIPLEAFTGNVPDISHLIIFGCTSYIHI